MSRRRLVLVASLLAAAELVIGVRIVQVMVFGHARFERMARRQQQRTLTVPSLRGEIRTADGSILAASLERVAIEVDSRALRYPKLFAQAAAPLIGATPGGIARRLAPGGRAVWLARHVTREAGRKVRSLAPNAVVLIPDSVRVYPLGALAAPVVGFVGREALRTVGRAGLEHRFDALLAGTPARYLAVRDAVQRTIRLRRISEGRPGFDLVLTLDARLQAACEAQLQSVLKRVGAQSASAVVLDPNNGRVLALASLPSFDPQVPGASAPAAWRLHPVQDAYEPGSTVKPLIAAAALAAGVIRPGETFDCRRGGITVDGHWIRDHADPARYTLDGIICHSSNAGIIMVAERLAPRFLFRSLTAYGLGHRPGLGFPGETPGILPSPDRWSRMSEASMSLGQEVTASPLQMAVAYAAIANGGWLPQPKLVLSVSGGRETAAFTPSWRRRVMGEALAARIRSMLESVVTSGTGREAALAGYRVAGKTGTAQRAFDGAFDHKHYVAWFAGFLPLPHPRAVIVVAVEDPVKDYWGSSVAAPAFHGIAAATVRLLGIPPMTGERVS
ncbi:MAG: penicillin-binding protein 2 [Acidobacteria bacterium]|nr:penicillin-binding protein 2 [Acidobacteriota bacterium]